MTQLPGNAMEISSNRLVVAEQAIKRSPSTNAQGTTSQDAVKTLHLLGALSPEADTENSQEALRAQLTQDVLSLGQELRPALIAQLHELEQSTASDEVRALLQERMPDIEKEMAQNIGIVHLVGLLYALILLMAKAGAVRNQASAKMGVMHIEQARLAGRLGVDGAKLGLLGAVVGLGTCAAVTGISWYTSRRVSKLQIKNIHQNLKEGKLLEKNADQLRTAIDRSRRTDTQGNSQRSQDIIRTDTDELRLCPADVPLDNNARLVVSQPAANSEVLAAAKEIPFKENDIKYGVRQQGSAALGQHGYILSSVMQSAGNIGMAAQNGDSKVAEVEGAMAQAGQNDAGQHAQRYDEQKRELFALVRTMQESHYSTAAAISSSMRV